MADIKSLVEKCEAAIVQLKKHGISPGSEASKESLSFKAKKDAYYLGAYAASVSELADCLKSIGDHDGLLAPDASKKFREIGQEISKEFAQHNLAKLQKSIALLKELPLEKGSPMGKYAEFSLPLQKLPEAVRSEMKADMEELVRCFRHDCFRSAIILCGRLMETALHRKYFEATNNDLLEKSPGIGLGNLIAKMSERNVKLPPGLSNQIHLINQVRISSVHKKQESFFPTKTQTEAIMLFTLDVIDQLFKG